MWISECEDVDSTPEQVLQMINLSKSLRTKCIAAVQPTNEIKKGAAEHHYVIRYVIEEALLLVISF